MALLADCDIYGDTYGDAVLERFARPRRAGVPASADRVGEAESRARSSRVRLHLALREGRVEQAGFEVLGCPHAIAAADLVCEDIEGRELAELARYDAGFLDTVLPLPAEKLDIRILLEDAVRSAAR